MRSLLIIAVLALFVIAFASADTDSLIKENISTHNVMVFSKSYCPYCKRAKEILRSFNVPVEVIELDQHPEGAQIQASLQKLTGQRTVPNIFIGGKHIGGSDAVAALQASGELTKLLEVPKSEL